MSNIPYRISSKSITLLLDDKPHIIPSSHPNFERLKDVLQHERHSRNIIRLLVDIPATVERASGGKVKVFDGEVQVDGQPCHNYLAERILQNMKQKLPIQPMVNFLNKLMSNPNEEVREDLWAWLESGDMPVTEDGCFIAYKYVQNDYYSRYHGYQGKVYHGVGQEVSMPRRQCDESRDHTCSSGLHFCGYEYLQVGYMGNDRVVIVRVDPADVVAIPTDYNNQKGRCCRYKVVGEIPQSELKDHYRGKGVAVSDDYIDLPEIDLGDSDWDAEYAHDDIDYDNWWEGHDFDDYPEEGFELPSLSDDEFLDQYGLTKEEFKEYHGL